MRRALFLAAALSLQSGCAYDGSVDWDRVGQGVLMTSLAVVTLGAAVAVSQPPPPPVYQTTCNSWRRTTTCTTY